MVNLLLIIAVLLVVTVGRTEADVKLSADNASPTPGKGVFVKCTVSAGETFIGWYKSGGSKIPISTTNRIRVKDTGGGVYKLKFVDTKVSDGGKYECRGSKKTVIFTLYVAFVATDVKLIQHLEIGKIGVIKVGVVGYPDPSFSWKKDGQSLNIAGDSCLTILKDGSLKICKVTKSHRGDYTVKIKQRSSEDDVKIEVYVVAYANIIEPFSRRHRFVTVGYPATFMCKATGFPAPKYKWLSPDGKELSSISNIKVQGGNLTFTTVGKDFTKGEYTCVAYIEIEETKEKIGEDREVVEVFQVYAAPYVDAIASPSKVYSYIGNNDQTLVRCKFGGYPKPWVIMKFEDKLMSNATTSAEIKLITDRKKTFGPYKCYAKNKYGWNNYTVELTIAGKPSEVLNFKAVPTCNSITLTWRTPTDDGGMPINKYVLTYKGVTRNIDGDDTTYTINDLKQNTKYSISLRATSKAEWGPIRSVEAQTNTYCAPGRPIIYSPSSIFLTNDTFTLKWRRPEETGGDDDITYTVRFRVEKDKNNHGPWKTVTTKKLQLEITGLDNKVTYKFEVTAKNKGGVSGPAEKYICPGATEECKCSCNDVMLAAIIGILVLIIIFLIIYIVWLRKKGTKREQRPDEENIGVGDNEIALTALRDPEPSNPILEPSNPILEPSNPILEPSNPIQPRSAEYMDLNEATVSADYAPLHPSTRSWEVATQHVTIKKIIGKGAFGQVAKGKAKLRSRPGKTTVAIKMLKPNSTESDKRDLLKELEMMKLLKPHPHVIKLLGCVTESEPLLVLIEYVPFGDLLGYLRKSRGLNDTYYNDPDIKPQSSLTSQQLMKFAWQIADGMSYLSSKSIIHRDLAARNVLVGEKEVCKVTDFGMARDVQLESIYERKTTGRVPVKWTAYEALMYGTYTTKSDIWSFGVVLYEIFTIGGSPYPRMDGKRVADLLQQGYRMPKPQHVDEKLYQIMMNCWQNDPDARPPFTDLKNQLKDMENQHKRLINMEMYDNQLYANVEDLVV